MIEIKDVEKIGVLARLKIEENEKAKYQEELSSILNFVEKINQLDLKDVEPTAHILDIHNNMREDKVKESLPLDKILSNAPEEKNGAIIVPKVI